MGLKLTFKGKDPADLLRQVNEFALGAGVDEARERLREQAQIQTDAATLSDPEYDAKYQTATTKPQMPDDQAGSTPPPPAQTRGRKRANGAKTDPAPAQPPPAQAPAEDETPTLEALKGAITTFYTQDPKGGKVRAAVDTLKPKLNVPFISQCGEEHRAALWAFCQQMGFEVA